MSDRTLLVDASPLIYATFNTIGHFCTKAGEPTGVRYGVLRSLRSWTEKTGAAKTVVVYDSPSKPKKAANVPTYKANRDMTKEKREMYDQVGALKQILAMTHYTQVEAVGYEADDILGSLARQLNQKGHETTIVSSDNDLLQTVSDMNQVWVPPKGSEKALTKDIEWVRSEFGVSPNGLLLWRAVEGDSSDNIDGLVLTRASKLSLKKTIAHLALQNPKSVVTVAELFAYMTQFVGHALTEVQAQYQKLADNYELMRLHDPDTMVITRGACDSNALLAEFTRLEMKSLLKHVDAFTRGAGVTV